MLTECFENLEIAHTAPTLDATGQSPVSASIGEAIRGTPSWTDDCRRR